MGGRTVRGHLGEAVTYSPGSGIPVVVQGIFDAAYVRVEGSGQASVSSCGPAVHLSLADLPSDPSEDEDATVTIRGVTYSVPESKPDGLGDVLLILYRT